MCGIVGYIGQLDAKEILLKGLEKLEYRGYDSAGIAVANEQGVHVYKEKGRIADLREVVDHTVESQAGIGHTRWATHGEPSFLNAHPHQSALGRFTLVHNGVIENYVQLKREYLESVELKSDTDTEVVVQMIEQFVAGGLSTEEAFRKTLTLLKGSYAIALFDGENTDTIYVAKNKSPLLIGLGDTFNVVASDAMAMLQVTNEYVELLDKEMVIVTKDEAVIKNLDGEVMTRASYIAELDASDIEKGTYPHYMLKETDEQPLVMRKIIQTYQDENGRLAVAGDVADAVAEADRIYIVACGTSYHAGLVGKQYIEMWANVPVEVHVASEFSYNMPLLSKKPLFIFLSQSGETADSRAVLVQVKALGHKALTITNVPGSTLSREADYTLLLHAGPEIAVASTKAYTAQIAVLAIVASVAAERNGVDIGFDLVKELGIAANAMEALCDQKDEMEMIAREYLTVSRNAFFIGRGLDYFVCVEGALKLKEISYIQAEGFAGGELKHGTIALIEEGTPVFALATQEHVNLSIRGNVKEVAARGANTCIISLKGLEDADDRFILPEVNPALAPLVSVVPLQLIAYYAALHRGCDVDKPRNLAKSVTVE
ncbi:MULTISPECIES: glutamine--fructose-6-phosphate transaminase (isomerizing) [Bacillus amyloliquefaciens group]|jgi:glucosamine--fructose-6-phosphate aminotransferase (isomerizing)|uniref:glutamine--fructose-6-phosphate transaminase (isomerizing) n=1 Tax=Bacillus amyloliquefaciens group TaxID=1938374 RepID=UPI001581295B|nr:MULTISPECIES: glutamine--fructose-6-phosphate transaminase (isomerizing) [Bacillus amyloliquefaciens group]NUI23001.1 glutamine--fructose-6-phosphate transaminase (isomerizing) [Bacillus amyloliquefaciens]NUI32107.1 glutamine--fructose-6-phosphate transaminase (isomerizing) [Bacillus amyloliquefaciens]NUI35813.1 glutamine--fructose-6-phosphate transaminase (isomerizing) [Bacillus amyloliquefaciens]NUI69660.1 glutamine--fructose-6-phosphate transaminase (isomerizing) [Bacillus amyloliquefacie